MPTIYVLSKNKKKNKVFSSANYCFYSCEILQYLYITRSVIVMTYHSKMQTHWFYHEQSDLSLHCFPRPICQKNLDHIVLSWFTLFAPKLNNNQAQKSESFFLSF